ncbi:MAG TPA: tetratricopeptide repeat protein [Patescibacteria group bacterium]|nr:tetratricopeptide repeat protein [Patescibacteria group bacterium]
MKYLILLVFSAGAVVGSAYYLHHPQTDARNDGAEIGDAGTEAPPVMKQTIASADLPPAIPKIETSVDKSVEAGAPKQRDVPETSRMELPTIALAVDLLLSPGASYEQKRAAWKQLRDGGGLDQAISDLQQRFTNNPNSGDTAAVLGHAYLQKCSTTSDIREQGILAMEADKLFDTALNLDPANWEARFTKAVALSYWPASMGKGDEVIGHFNTLIQQQEAQPQQPQFAEAYLWLGDQYKKAGRPDDARSVWERGAVLFPSDQKLTSRLASAP